MMVIMLTGMAVAVSDKLKLAGLVVEGMKQTLILVLKLEGMEFEHTMLEMMEIQSMEMDEAALAQSKMGGIEAQ
jgi:hypothetical protein